MSKNEITGSSVAKAIAGLLLLVVVWNCEAYERGRGESYYNHFLGTRVGPREFFYARSLVCVIAAYSAYLAFSKARSGQSGWGWIFGGVALLLNPVMPQVDLRVDSMANIIVSMVFFSSIAWDVGEHKTSGGGEK